MLEFKNVTKQFERITAVNDISFQIDDGKVLGIVGRNGARKIHHFSYDFKTNGTNEWRNTI